MVQPNDNNNSIWPSQNARLGSFLIASSFLVAAFIQLVITDNDTTKFFEHAVAALGSVLAILYFLMNLWPVMPKCLPKWMRKDEPSTEQVLHTWLVPFFFLLFWMAAWIEVNNYWSICTVVISVGILLLIFIIFIPIQKCRDKRSQRRRRTMKVKATCRKCGYIVEGDLEVEVTTNGLEEALRFLHHQMQEHHHPEVNDLFKWRLGWEGLVP